MVTMKETERKTVCLIIMTSKLAFSGDVEHKKMQDVQSGHLVRKECRKTT